MLDYSPLLMLFNFGGQGELCVVHDAHLFVLQIYASSFETS
jgi:hypothetical protein